MAETTEEIPIINKNDDSALALAILVIAAVLVVLTGLYLWRTKKIVISNDSSFKQSSFTPPPEREAYLKAKKTLDVSKISQLDELKKLLMRRALHTIPILLSLQNEGSSIERLYKRGMLTDDMHFKVKELKAFVDQEFQDIQFEADDLVEGWAQHIWPQAMQFHQMVQKQADSKNEQQRLEEEEKKKAEAQKKKDAKKALKVSDAPSSAAVASEEDPAAAAERMAAQLLAEEEERQQSGGKKGSGSASKKK